MGFAANLDMVIKSSTLMAKRLWSFSKTEKHKKAILGTVKSVLTPPEKSSSSPMTLYFPARNF